MAVHMAVQRIAAPPLRARVESRQRRSVGVAKGRNRRAGGSRSLSVASADAMQVVKTIAVIMLLALIMASVIGVFAQQPTTATTEDGPENDWHTCPH